MNRNSELCHRSRRASIVQAACEGLESRQLFAVAPVTITTVNSASEAGPTAGAFQISRTSTNRSAALTVMLQLGGTATYGSDYTLSSLVSGQDVAVTIPANETSTLLRVTPIDDQVAESTETVEVTAVLVDSTVTPPHAVLSIADNDSGSTDGQSIADANGPYHVSEGRTETLHGTATALLGRTISTYQWDYNYDGVTFNVDATGATPLFSAVGIDGTRSGVVRTIGLRVIDSANVTSAVSTSTITIVNAAPTATLRGGNVFLGRSGTVSFSNIKDVPADVAAGFIYRFDFNNDGVIDLATHRSSATVPPNYLRTAGAHTVRATITDKDGGVSSYTTTLTVIRTSTPAKFTPAGMADLQDRFSLAELA